MDSIIPRKLFFFFKHPNPLQVEQGIVSWKNLLSWRAKGFKMKDIAGIVPQSCKLLWFIPMKNLVRPIFVTNKDCEFAQTIKFSDEEEAEDIEKKKHAGSSKIFSGPMMSKQSFETLKKCFSEDMNAKKALESKMFFSASDNEKHIDNPLIFINGDTIYGVNERRKRKLAYFGQPKEIIFFTRNKKILYLGYEYWQFQLKKFSKDKTDVLEKAIIETGSKIGVKSNEIYEGYLNLWEWIKFLLCFWKWFSHVSETISITDEAIIYSKKGRKRQESAYLRFKDIFYAGRSKGRLNVFGKQNIITENRFSRGANERIKEILYEHGINCDYIVTYTPSIFGGFFDWFFNRYWIKISDNRLIFKGKVLYGAELKKGETDIRCYLNSNVVFCKSYKHHWYNLHGTIYVVFNPKNIRKDQESGSEVIKMEHLWSSEMSSIKKVLKESAENGIDGSGSGESWKSITKRDYKAD